MVRRPLTAASAPAKPTAAYTSELTKRVQGLVREEKNVALSEQSRRRSFTSSNAARVCASWPKA